MTSLDILADERFVAASPTITLATPPPEPSALADVAVVVPTKNERDNIVAFLASLPDEIPLVVVDASTDDTRDIIRARRPRNTTIIESDAHISEARQIGAEACDASWLLFTDADVVFCPEYFTNLLAKTVVPGTGGVVGQKLSLDDHQRYYAFISGWQGRLTRIGIPAASGSNMLISRVALEACGGFDPTLRVNEDTEIMFRVRRSGFVVGHADDLVVYARDHRRLTKGTTRKTVHSVVRSGLLLTGLFPKTVRSSDWGYWT